MTLAEPLAVTLKVTAVLETLGLEYAVGGSLASSMHGIPRSTNDADVLVKLPGRAVDDFITALEGEFYVDRDMVMDAVHHCSSFNVIHLRTMFKVDVFVADRSGLVREELARRVPAVLGDPPCTLQVCTAEDIILQKLLWFRAGHEISERQWGDLVGVIQVQGDNLDREYLRRWVAELDLADLAHRAFNDAGQSVL